ncbi:MAG: acyltransferase family protein [Pseudomonadota bacterium]
MQARRHDIDALRAIALFLLILYHAWVSIMPFGAQFGMVATVPATPAPVFDAVSSLLGILLNIWRIPILFLVSGMAVWFLAARRSPGALARERVVRLGLPLLFGWLVVGPGTALIFPLSAGATLSEALATLRPNAAHLWFLKLILPYALAFALLLAVWPGVRARLSVWDPPPPVIFAVWTAGLVLITLVTRPANFEAWFSGPHTPVFGALCFGAGVVMAASGPRFQAWSARWAPWLAAVALLLYIPRVPYTVAKFQAGTLLYPDLLFYAAVAVESAVWMTAALGFSARVFRGPRRWVSAAVAAVFPVYILHWPVQNLTAWALRDVFDSKAQALAVLVAVELAVCFCLYHAVARVGVLRPLFGMRPRETREF